MGEDGCLHAKDGGLRRNQSCQHLGLGLPASRTVRTWISAVQATPSVVFVTQPKLTNTLSKLTLCSRMLAYGGVVGFREDISPQRSLPKEGGSTSVMGQGIKCYQARTVHPGRFSLRHHISTEQTVAPNHIHSDAKDPERYHHEASPLTQSSQ